MSSSSVRTMLREGLWRLGLLEAVRAMRATVEGAAATIAPGWSLARKREAELACWRDDLATMRRWWRRIPRSSSPAAAAAPASTSSAPNWPP